MLVLSLFPLPDFEPAGSLDVVDYWDGHFLFVEEHL